MPHHLWSDLTAPDLQASVDDRTVALVPVGATEQHGPHLPLNTDAVLAEAMAHEAARRVGDARVLVLPTLTMGKSDEHGGFPAS